MAPRGWSFAGVLGGLSSIWSPPVAMYLLARNVSKIEFIGATGFYFWRAQFLAIVSALLEY